MQSEDPTTIASELKAKGMSREQISDYLMSEGYSAIQASDAANQADIMNDVDEIPVPRESAKNMQASVMDSDSDESLDVGNFKVPEFSEPKTAKKFDYGTQPQQIAFQPRNDLPDCRLK